MLRNKNKLRYFWPQKYTGYFGVIEIQNIIAFSSLDLAKSRTIFGDEDEGRFNMEQGLNLSVQYEWLLINYHSS